MRDEGEEAIRSYFGQKGFEQFLKLLQKQYVSSQDGVRGYVTLANISDVERSTLDSFYGIYSPPAQGETRRYSLKTFEQLLANSRFGLTVPELLELLNGEPVFTRREQALRTKEEWEGVIRLAMEDAFAVAGDAGDSSVRGWAEGLIDESSLGSRTLRIVFARSPEEARFCLAHCLAALNKVVAGGMGKPVRLPVVAAQVTGDAHALDWKYPLGRLFWWGLTAIHGQELDHEVSEVSEDNPFEPADMSDASDSQSILIREGYRRGGVADDDLSSLAMVYAPELFGIREEQVLTLRQVERLSSVRLIQMRYVRIYMVENPSVFAELMDADARMRQGTETAPMILCGNGQPSTAVVKLLDTLLSNREEALLYYAGDLDPAGMGIAQSLRQRYPQAFRAWRMDKEQYLRYVHKGMMLTDAERSRLKEGQYEWGEALAATMGEKGVKLHQELWVDELIQDVIKASPFS
jgi:uncharacterized protein (TIGR02679 family)